MDDVRGSRAPHCGPVAMWCRPGSSGIPSVEVEACEAGVGAHSMTSTESGTCGRETLFGGRLLFHGEARGNCEQDLCLPFKDSRLDVIWL